MNSYFLQTLQRLCRQEEVLLYNNLLQVTEAHQQEAALYLAEEYGREKLNYPSEAPLFNGPAALWASQRKI